MHLRRNSLLLLLLLLPVVLYTFMLYVIIGRTCGEDSATLDVDLTGEDVRYRRVLAKQRTSFFRKSGDTFVRDVNLQARDYRAIVDSSSGHAFGHSQATAVSRPTYLFNCTNVPFIKLRKKIGHGVSKQTFLGEYRGHHVAVKMVTRHIHTVKSCLDDVRVHDREASVAARSKCYLYSTMKLMKEILLAEQLSHQNLAQLLGYCIRSEESDSTDIAEHGVVSVFELGSRFVLDNLQILPWPVRLQSALEMADLLHYFEHSPLGSLVIPDFKEGHFVLVNSSLKLIDLDDINNVEPACSATAIRGDNAQCEYGVTCRRALCIGFNAKENMKNMNRLIFKRLLFPLTFPESVMKDVGQLNANLDLLALSAAELRLQLKDIHQRAKAKTKW